MDRYSWGGRGGNAYPRPTSAPSRGHNETSGYSSGSNYGRHQQSGDRYRNNGGYDSYDDRAAKRQRPDPVVHHQHYDDSNTAQIRVSSIPDGYDEDKMRQLFEYIGLAPRSIIHMRFLRPADGCEVVTRTARMNFESLEAANAAISVINGQEVVTQTGDKKCLSARLEKRTEETNQDGSGLYPSVYVSDIPVEYTEPMVRDLHEQSGLDVESIMSMKFLPSKADKLRFKCRVRQESENTGALIIRYRDDESAQSAIDTLHNAEVVTSSGATKSLGVKLAKPASWMHGSGDGGYQMDRQSMVSAMPSKQKADNPIYPSVYISDAPLEYTEAMFRDLHRDSGLDPESIMSMKILPSKNGFGSTGACIIRYADDDAAQAAIAALDKAEVNTSSGDRKWLGARLAKPASWMHTKPDYTPPPVQSYPSRGAKRKWSDGPQESGHAIKVSNLPEGYGEKMLTPLLEYVGIDPLSFQSMKVLKQSGDGTFEALIFFTTAEIASSACEALHEQEVTSKTGQVHTLSAEAVDAQQYQVAPASQSWGMQKKDKDGPTKALFPSVYLSDVPSEYTDEMIRDMHGNAGLNVDKIMAIKFLPSKHGQYGATGACIVRYADDDAANEAIMTLRGTEVYTASFEKKFLGAKLAKPAAWMLQR